MDILILLVMILVNGVFAMSEMAVVSSKKIRLESMAAAGTVGAQVALALAEKPSHFLATIQVGITLIGILSGAYGEAALVVPLATALSAIPVVGPFAAEISLGIVVVGITFFSLILGELVPKRLALRQPETVAALIARPMKLLERMSAPFVKLLSYTTEMVLELMGVRDRDVPPVTEEEIQGLMKQGMDAGVFEAHEHRLVSRVFQLDERKVSSILTPGVDIVYLDLAAPLQVNLDRLVDYRHAHYPLCRGGLGQTVGILTARNLLSQALKGVPLDLEALAKPALYVPDNITLIDLLEHLKRNRADMALAVNEFGEIQGLVTLDDVVEAIVGDLPAADEEEPADIVQRDDGSWLIDGSVSLDRLRETLGRDFSFPDEETGEYHTIAGLVITALGRIPSVGDVLVLQGYRFEVVDMDRQRVDRVMLSLLPPAQALP